MDTTITISSSTSTNSTDFVHLTYNTGKNEDAMISVDSSGFERVPVTWDENSSFSQSKQSFLNIQSNWMKGSTSDVENEVMKDIRNITSQSCTYPTSFSLEKTNSKEVESKSLILVRCDFNKSTNAQSYYPSLNRFNRSTSLIKYFKEEQDAPLPNISCLTQNSNPNNSNYTKDHQKQVGESEVSKSIVCESHNQFSTNEDPCLRANHKMTNENLDSTEVVPLSPESRKKELCKYLQLMNPADKKEISKLQNRRSTRVRNLTVMQEQKQLQDKLKQVEQDNINEKSEICATLKSFRELNITVGKYEAEEEESEKSFSFPFPPNQMIENINHFDIIMSAIVPSLKRMCKYRNIKYTNFNKNKQNLKAKKIRIISPSKCRSKDNGSTAYKTRTNKKTTKEKTESSVEKHKIKISNMTRKNNSERKNSLRSKGKLKNISIKKLVGKKDKEISRWKMLKQKELREQHKISKDKCIVSSASVKPRRVSDSKSTSSKCEIVSVGHSIEDNIDLENFMDDMVDFDNLSEEHKKCLIENRILSTKPIERVLPSEDASLSFCSLQSLSPLYGFGKPVGSSTIENNKNINSESKTSVLKSAADQEKDKNVAIEFSRDDKLKLKKTVDKNGEAAPPIIGGNTYLILNIHRPEIQVQNQANPAKVVQTENIHVSTGTSLQEHDYAGSPNRKKIEDEEVDVVTVPVKNLPVGKYLEINTKQVPKNNKYELHPYNRTVEMKSLHRSLQFTKKKSNLTMDSCLSQEWNSEEHPKQKLKKPSHPITISRENGAVMRAFYIDYNLIVCQEYLISFWMQTPLGNVLGSQNIGSGQTQRIVLNTKCIQKESMERVISTETSVVYIELWMKEHKSEMRQGPVADVFITLYFWKQRHNGLDKKVLQLENINGFADDVQYSVMKTAPKIIVSWHCTNEDNVLKRTFIHAYLLAADYQTVSNIYDIEPVDHYVSSLHNIEDCDNLIMGCGENKITLWNVEFGYIIATVELTEIKSPLSTLWVKCDRGFLFALQQCVDRELRLIAINGTNHSWKKLASYFPPEGFDRLRGVCVENGLLLSFYDQGILCWKAETGEPIEEVSLETDVIPSGKHVILVEENQIIVKHVMTHLMSMSVEES
ncbi:hypothetical protein JTB14_020803 [Gonioctena quinquepunctata]|nr:hypothetical protein JTB14_020803 [Gonioctena quinquepunctata]